ncbi:MaoC family dehydratase [Sphingomonas profundi]|uniref:MaoC family dehydratase n=1 Tax=Alterirhizorhabdus profundi TaxID=2681549 RepID=UPI0012E7195F|nr:MaoC family dehydratase [Sphingomonas profundi]
MATLSIADMQAKTGEEIAVSEWILVDQAMIDAFAETTMDRQFIHIDPVKARMTPFGGTIAHGFLTLSLLSAMMEQSDMPTPEGVKMAVNYGFNKMRFLTPVPSGSRVRGRFKLAELDEKRPGQLQQTLEATVEIEGGAKPALIAEWITQIFV